jgi:hypothetical protein
LGESCWLVDIVAETGMLAITDPGFEAALAASKAEALWDSNGLVYSRAKGAVIRTELVGSIIAKALGEGLRNVLKSERTTRSLSESCSETIGSATIFGLVTGVSTVSTTRVRSGNFTPFRFEPTRSPPKRIKTDATMVAKSAKTHPLTPFLDRIVIRESPRTFQMPWPPNRHLHYRYRGAFEFVPRP